MARSLRRAPPPGLVSGCNADAEGAASMTEEEWAARMREYDHQREMFRQAVAEFRACIRAVGEQLDRLRLLSHAEYRGSPGERTHYRAGRLLRAVR